MKKKPLIEISKTKKLVMSDLDRIMKKIQRENDLIDDHGQSIIGTREQMPIKVESEEE